MLFALVGIFKHPRPPNSAGFESALNEHLAQSALRIVNAGYLRNRDGEKVGFAGVIEARSFEMAEAFVESGPFATGGQLDHLHLATYDVEVGRLG